MIADGAHRLWRLANRSTIVLNDKCANLKITPQLRPSHCVTPTPGGRAVEARAGQGDRCPVSTSITGSYMPRRPGARVTVTNSNRHPCSLLLLTTGHRSTRPPRRAAAACMPLAGNHWSNSAAAHADPAPCAARNKRNRYQAAPSRPAPWSRRPTGRGHPGAGRHEWPVIPSARPAY